MRSLVASLKHLRLRISALRKRDGFGTRAAFLLALALSLSGGAFLFRGGVEPGKSQTKTSAAPFSNVVLDNRSAGAPGRTGARGR